MSASHRKGDGATRGQSNAALVGHTADDGGDRVGRVARLDRRRAADGARAAVDGQPGWKGG